jgi:hypothetical protein
MSRKPKTRGFRDEGLGPTVQNQALFHHFAESFNITLTASEIEDVERVVNKDLVSRLEKVVSEKCAAERGIKKWKRVSDFEMPEFDGPVLACAQGDAELIGIATLLPGGRWINEVGNRIAFEITHWMELPEPPEE